MNAFGFKPDIKIIDYLRQKHFTLSAEVIPPRNSAEQQNVLSQIEALIGAGAEFLSVTKGAGGSLRGGSLPIAQSIKERLGVPAIAHFTCRDLTPHEVENQLMDHHYFGIRNILALRGDPPDDQPQWTPKSGAYEYAYQLITQIKRLNQGEFFVRPSEKGAANAEFSKPTQTRTDFCIGCAVYPEHPVEEERSRFFKLKVDAGAEYAITQMLFDPEAYARFLDLCGKHGLSIPVIPGSRLIKTRAMALRLAERFHVSVPQATIDALAEKDSPDAQKRSLEQFLLMVEKFRSYGAPGVHVFVIVDGSGACQALQRLAESN